MAKLARLRHPERAIPRDLRRTILAMGQLAQRLMAQTAEVLITRDLDAALQMERDDDRMDELHRAIFQHLMTTGGTTGSRQPWMPRSSAAMTNASAITL